MMYLKLDYNSDKLNEKTIKFIKQLIEDEDGFYVKLTTNKLIYERDRKDERFITALKKIKIILEKGDGHYFILSGNLSCNFNTGKPWTGSFYVTQNVVINNQSDFEKIKGVREHICFTDSAEYSIKNDDLKYRMTKIAEDGDFVYNLSQFDEFMELFEFYKQLSTAISNSKSYKIKRVSDPFYFEDISDKVEELIDEQKTEMLKSNGELVGYKVSKEQYQKLSNDTQSHITQLLEIEIEGEKSDYDQIWNIGLDNVYVSNHEQITDKNIEDITQINIKNIIRQNTVIKIVTEFNGNIASCKFLNLYDMGQKIKVESIDNSLRLIKQGETGDVA